MKIWVLLLLLSIALVIGGIIYDSASSNPQFWWVIVGIGLFGIVGSIALGIISGTVHTAGKGAKFVAKHPQVLVPLLA